MPFKGKHAIHSEWASNTVVICYPAMFPTESEVNFCIINSTFMMRYGMKDDASFSVRWYSSWLSILKSNLRYSSVFIRTLVLVSKNRRVSHFRIRSRQLMTPSFSFSKCFKQHGEKRGAKWNTLFKKSE